MNIKWITSKLEDTISYFIKKGYFKSDICFSFGDIVEKTAEASYKFAPSGSTLILYIDEKVKELAEKVALILKNKQINAVIKKIENSSDRSVEHLSEFLPLSEDLRCVISFESDANFYSEYFSFIKSCPFIYSPIDGELYNAFNSFICVRNGGKIDRVYLETERAIVIDNENLSEKDFANLYAFIMSKLCVVSDYRIFCFYNKTNTDSNCFNLLKECLTETFSVFETSKQKRNDLILLNALKTGLSDYYSNGQIFSSYSARKSVERVNLEYSNAELYAFSKIIELYNLYFCGKYKDLLLTPDYNQTAEIISEKFNLNKADLKKQLLTQLKKLYPFSKGEEIRNKLKNEVTSLYGFNKKILNSFIALSGKETERYNKKKINYSIKFCGDFDGVNGMTLVREDGILEAIKEQN